jgi:ABC-type uncharacterized transport system substrate-binding protein
MEGKAPADIPIREYVPEAIGVHLGLAGRYGITIPEDILKKATTVKR